jgi:hypothetical protein
MPVIRPCPPREISSDALFNIHGWRSGKSYQQSAFSKKWNALNLFKLIADR